MSKQQSPSTSRVFFHTLAYDYEPAASNNGQRGMELAIEAASIGVVCI